MRGGEARAQMCRTRLGAASQEGRQSSPRVRHCRAHAQLASSPLQLCHLCPHPGQGGLTPEHSPPTCWAEGDLPFGWGPGRGGQTGLRNQTSKIGGSRRRTPREQGLQVSCARPTAPLPHWTSLTSTIPGDSAKNLKMTRAEPSAGPFAPVTSPGSTAQHFTGFKARSPPGLVLTSL